MAITEANWFTRALSLLTLLADLCDRCGIWEHLGTFWEPFSWLLEILASFSQLQSCSHLLRCVSLRLFLRCYGLPSAAPQCRKPAQLHQHIHIQVPAIQGGLYIPTHIHIHNTSKWFRLPPLFQLGHLVWANWNLGKVQMVVQRLIGSSLLQCDTYRFVSQMDGKEIGHCQAIDIWQLVTGGVCSSLVELFDLLTLLVSLSALRRCVCCC